MLHSSGISRRQALALLAAAPVAAAARRTPVAVARPATFVLVHGAWHGGWCWTKLSPLLRAAGHAVFAPTLTGLGERSHLLTRSIDLDTHITDIVQVLEYEDLNDVILVGHSYGGMVITGVADRSAARVGQLVFLDAFVPEGGKSVSDYGRHYEPATDEGWHDPSPSTPQDLGVTDPREAAWVKARLTDMPRNCMTQPLRLSAKGITAIRGTFIRCTNSPFFVAAGERAKQRGYRSREFLSGGHDAMVTQPAALADLLLELT